MDRRQKTIDVVKALHQYQDKTLDDSELIKIVCNYYDEIKNGAIKQNDLEFLFKIANVCGIPHYFDHLKKFQNDIELEVFSLSTLSSQIYESTLHTDEQSKVHRYQKSILNYFKPDKQNRYFLSASTSFGKTHLVYEVLKKMKYKNIVLMFPTIALLSENLERLLNDKIYDDYRVHTLSDVKPEDMEGKNIFVYTPERFLSFIEKSKVKPKFDFIFIDEVYKIDNEYIIDEEESKESERDVSYRIAAHYSVIDDSDLLLAGPYIEKYSVSFERFLDYNKIIKCDFNKYEIVGKSTHNIKAEKKVDVEDNLHFIFSDDEAGKQERLNKIVRTLYENSNENCIIYCSAPHYAESYAKKIPTLINYQETPQDYKLFVEHVAREYGYEWIVSNCLKKGIGIHHGLIPKYIQKEIVSYFNQGNIIALVSTTTITEGVNTSAKNIVITNNKKGRKSLKRFDAKNIAGRAGRFDQHYSGRVIILKNDFLKDLEKDKESIRHKNYDLDSRKDEIDLFYSQEEFLSVGDLSKREAIIEEQEKRNIPDHILEMFKVVSKADKIKLFDAIDALDTNKSDAIIMLIQKVNNPGRVGIDWNGLQVILDCIYPIVNQSMKDLLDRKTNKGTGEHSVLVPMLHNYLETGFKGLVDYRIKDLGDNIDQATRTTAKFVYNTAKYQLVKYLGVFNVLYRFHKSRVENRDFDEVSGFDKLLAKLEYNALTDEGKKVSDYGVPAKVLQYYEEGRKSNIASSFDEYENRVFRKVNEIVSDNRTN